MYIISTEKEEKKNNGGIWVQRESAAEHMTGCRRHIIMVVVLCMCVDAFGCAIRGRRIYIEGEKREKEGGGVESNRETCTWKQTATMQISKH